VRLDPKEGLAEVHETAVWKMPLGFKFRYSTP
jgi:hypothetical protein